MIEASEAGYYEQSALWGPSHTGTARQTRRIDDTIALLPSDVRSLADVGAGDGALLRRLADRGITTVSLDRSAAALSHAPRPAVRGSVDRLPFRDTSLDAVAACEVIEHLPEPVLDACLRELERVAQRFVVITVPNAENLALARRTCAHCGCVFHPNRHLRSFTPTDLHRLMPTFRTRTVSEIGDTLDFPPEALVRAVRALRALRGRRVRPGPNHVCPQCGLAGSPTARPAASTGPRPARRWVPGTRRSIWLAAVYERP